MGTITRYKRACRDVIIHGDSLEVLRGLESESVQCCITSPPYWGLRDYGIEGQLGLEPTPEQYVAKMVAIFSEVKRVLRPDGTLWLNLGDSYANDGKWGGSTGGKHADGLHGDTGIGRRRVSTSLKPKDLIGIPWRVAFALQADGWYLRSDIIWSKPNPMPESVTDRPTKAHEYVFLMSKSARYYYDQEAVREPSNWDLGNTKYPDGWDTAEGSHGTIHRSGREKGKKIRGHKRPHEGFDNKWDLMDKAEQASNGRNRRTVWTIPTRPYPGAHFAVFPETLVEPCLMAGTSEKGCCPECGAAWERVVELGEIESTGGSEHNRRNGHTNFKGSDMNCGTFTQRQHITAGWQPTCSCPEAEPVPCTVLDPFMGSGTVAKVALRARRHYIGIELNQEYIELAEKRLAPLKRQGNLL